MILTNVFWPLFAVGSFFSSQDQAAIKKPKALYPGHTLYKLNDGNVIPSPAWGTGTGTVRSGNATADTLRALDNGWRHIDTSLNYFNQKATGEAIRLSGIPRDELYITTKYDAIDGKDASTEIVTTLEQLGLDYVDSYLIHFPKAAAAGGGIKKIWPQLEKIVEDGLAKSIGVSNYDTPELLQEIYDIAKIKPAVNQILYNVYRYFDVAPALALGAKHGLLFSAWGELQPITRYPGGPADAVGNAIAKRLSKDTGSEVTYAQVIFDWLKSTGILAVTTTSNEGRLKEQREPFADNFPLLTAEEVRTFELSGIGFKAD